MALFDNLSEGVKKVFLAGVGAVAIGAEKSQELVDELIRRGELTVEQGKVLNEELSRKVKETTSDAYDEVLRGRLRGMSPEERAEWIARAKKISEDLEAEDASFEVEPEEAAEEESEVAEETEVEVEEVVEAEGDAAE